jgi:hypothetical protein
MVECMPFLWNTSKDPSTSTISEKCEVFFFFFFTIISLEINISVCERNFDQTTITNKSIPD